MADFLDFMRDNVVNPVKDFGGDIGIPDFLKSSLGAASGIMKGFAGLGQGVGAVFGNTGTILMIVGGVLVVGVVMYLIPKSPGK